MESFITVRTPGKRNSLHSEKHANQLSRSTLSTDSSFIFSIWKMRVVNSHLLSQDGNSIYLTMFSVFFDHYTSSFSLWDCRWDFDLRTWHVTVGKSTCVFVNFHLVNWLHISGIVHAGFCYWDIFNQIFCCCLQLYYGRLTITKPVARYMKYFKLTWKIIASVFCFTNWI